jgi:hypothetical protein
MYCTIDKWMTLQHHRGTLSLGQVTAGPPRAWPQGGVPHAPTAPPRYAASVRTQAQCRAPAAPHAAAAVPHVCTCELQAQGLQLPWSPPSDMPCPMLDLQLPPSLPTVKDDKSAYLALLEFRLRGLERWGGWRGERGGAAESVRDGGLDFI